jgi:hypothetical protein
MSFDPDDDRWAERAAEVAVTTMTLEPGGEFTVKFRATEFNNPWHDEIGRFAPKGYGHMGGNKYSREVAVPRSVEDAAAVYAAMTLYNAVNRGDPMPAIHEALHALIKTAEAADQDLMERLIKPAARAIGDNDMDTAHELIVDADSEVFKPFTEEFEVPPPEKITVTGGQPPESGFGPTIWQTVTPEGHTITFNSRGHTVTDEQAYTILSAATTAARAGNMDQDVTIQVQASFNRDTMSREPLVMGFVVANPDIGTDPHRTVNITPELINGNFDPGGSTERIPSTLTASAALVEPLRITVLHEMGHVSLFEEAFHRQGDLTQGKEWFNEQMIQTANTTPITDKPFMSLYAQENTTEMHAEAFAEWTNTGGNTNNPWVLRMADQYGWSTGRAAEDLPLAAAGAPPIEPWVPIWYFPEEPVILIDSRDGASYVYGDAALAATEPVVASAGQFMNPWHDEIGRFAPKGTGSKFDAVSAMQDVQNGKPVSVTGVEAVDLALEMARLYHPIDMTLVTVDGSHMFSEMRANGRSRVEMPQIPGKFHPAFEEHLRELGVTMTPETIDPRELHGTQSELDGQAVGNMIQSYRDGGFNFTSKPLVVSSDNRILDGHHRWAAAAIESAACGGCIEMPIMRVDLPMSELLHVADDFVDSLGIVRQGHGEHGKHSPQPPPLHEKIAAAVIPPSQNEQVEFEYATDTDDGITDEQLADLPHGDGSAFEEGEGVVASPASFANPWHDEIGRFAPKGTGTKIGFDADAASNQFADDLATLNANADAMAEPYRIHYERGGEKQSTFAQARDEYLAYGSSEMDRQLRTNGDSTVKDPAHRRALMNAVVLDEAIERSGVVFAEDTVLLRGVRNTQAGNLTVGTEFTDPAFVSVTASPGEAAQASGQQQRPAGFPPSANPGTIVALKVPKGTKAMPGAENEKEWVLPRGGTYTVTNVIEGDGVRIAEVEVTFPESPPVTKGIPTINDLLERTAGQQERRGLAASAGGLIVHERLSWDPADIDVMTNRRQFRLIWDAGVLADATITRAAFGNPWHDEVGRFAPKGTGKQVAAEGRARELLAGERIALADVDVPMGTPEQIKLTTDTRDDDALWETATPIKVSAQDKFVASEESVKTRPVRDVVLDGEAFRPGYPPRLYQLPDGSYLVADGHHRIVMHKLLGTPSFDAIVLPYPEEKQ